jgi:hypothetical protein
MTIDEIKKVLGIDVLKPNRTDLYVYLKSLYFFHEFSKKRTKISIANDLCMNHSSLVNYEKNIEKYRNDPLFIYIKNAFDNFDKTQITEFLRLQKNKRYYATSTYGESKIKLKEIRKRTNKVELLKENIEKRPKMQEVSFALRKIKTNLNSKVLNEWTEKDWKDYYKLTKQD